MPARVIKLDSESAAGEKRIKAVDLKGHVPILLLINGSDKLKRSDGTAIVFKDFPAGAGNPLGLNVSWSVGNQQISFGAAGSAVSVAITGIIQSS